jgi:hypothetical protein
MKRNSDTQTDKLEQYLRTDSTFMLLETQVHL